MSPLCHRFVTSLTTGFMSEFCGFAACKCGFHEQVIVAKDM
jgi:hypothetical protein